LEIFYQVGSDTNINEDNKQNKDKKKQHNVSLLNQYSQTLVHHIIDEMKKKKKLILIILMTNKWNLFVLVMNKF